MKPHITPRLAAICVALLFYPLLVNGGAPADPQQAGKDSGKPPVMQDQFSVEATSVVVDVIVTDKKGRPVTNLNANDFRVYEEGKEQKVTTFAPPNPAAYTEPAAVAPKSATSTPVVPTALPPTQKRPEQFLTVVLDL